MFAYRWRCPRRSANERRLVDVAAPSHDHELTVLFHLFCSLFSFFLAVFFSSSCLFYMYYRGIYITLTVQARRRDRREGNDAAGTTRREDDDGRKRGVNSAPTRTSPTSSLGPATRSRVSYQYLINDVTCFSPNLPGDKDHVYLISILSTPTCILRRFPTYMTSCRSDNLRRIHVGVDKILIRYT